MYQADVFVMGNDWEGKFDFLKPYCEVIYLSRTPSISSTRIRDAIIPDAAKVGMEAVKVKPVATAARHAHRP